MWRLVVQTTTANGFAMVGSAASLFITARYLGPEGRGILAAASGWAVLAATLGSFSVGQVVLHRAAQRNSDSWLPEVTGALTVVVAGSVSLGWTVAAISYVVTDGHAFNNLTPSICLLAFAALPFLIWNDLSRCVLYALDALPIANRSAVVGAMVSVIGVVLLVPVLRFGVAGALLAIIGSNVAMAVVNGVFIAKRGGQIRPAWRTAAALFGDGLQLHLNAIGSFLFTQASVLILNWYRAAAEVGYYQLAIQLLNFTLVLATAISAVGYGLVSRKGPDAAWGDQRVLLAQSLAVAAALVIAAIVAAPILIPLVFAARFAPSVRLFQIVSLGLLGATFSAVMASQWIGRGLFWQTGVLTFAIGLISVTCDFWFIPRYGMNGAVVSTLVTYGISVLGNGGMAVFAESRWRSLPLSGDKPGVLATATRSA